MNKKLVSSFVVTAIVSTATISADAYSVSNLQEMSKSNIEKVVKNTKEKNNTSKSDKESKTNESKQQVIEIKTIEDLENINNNLAGSYKLVKNIDLNGKEVKIGSKDEPFTGTFDGSNYTISNLVSTGGVNIGNGLFVSTKGATIKNVILKSPTVSGNYYTGALVGISYDSTIDCVQIQNAIVNCEGITTGVSLLDSASTYAGGVVGWCENTNISHSQVLNPNITNTTPAAVEGLKYPTYYSGGVTGANKGGKILNVQVLEGSVKSSHQSTVGLISVTKPVAGGITGLAEGALENVYTDTRVDTYGRIDVPLGGVEPTSGGIAGYFGNGGSIKSAVFKGIVNTETRYMGIGTHDKWTGGIVGWQQGGNLGDIQGAYYHKEKSTPNDVWKQFGAIWDKSNTNQYGPITDEKFGDKDLFLGFNFGEYWHIDKETNHVMYGPGVGDGSEDDNIQIVNKPVIEGVENKTILKGEKFDVLDGVKASDVEDGDITRYIDVIGDVDINTPGEYKITYTVKDRDNNETIVERIITVVKTMVSGEDTDGDGNADVNIDIDNDGKADINIDTDGDGVPDINVDTNGDGKADVNIDTDGDGKADVNISQKPESWKPELDADIDGNGEIDYDTDENYPKPSTNIDIDNDGKADINIDTDGDGVPDVNVDTTGDGKADINIDTDGDRVPDVNVDTTGDGNADVNIDTDGDGKADKDTVTPPSEWNPGINVDTNGDGKPNYDTDENYPKPEESPEPGENKTIVKAAYWKNEAMLIDGYHKIEGLSLDNVDGKSVKRTINIIDENGNIAASVKASSVNWETGSYSKDLTGFQVKLTKDEFAQLEQGKSYKLELETMYDGNVYKLSLNEAPTMIAFARSSDWIDGYHKTFESLGTHVISGMTIKASLDSDKNLVVTREADNKVEISITKNKINSNNELVLDGSISSSFDFNKKHEKYIIVRDSEGNEVFNKKAAAFKDKPELFQVIIPSEFVGENFIYEIQVNTKDVVIFNSTLK